MPVGEKRPGENPPRKSAPTKRKRLSDDDGDTAVTKEAKQGSLTFPKDLRKKAPVRTHRDISCDAPRDVREPPACPNPSPRKRPAPAPKASGPIELPPESISSHQTSSSSRHSLPQLPRIVQCDIPRGKSVALTKLLSISSCPIAPIKDVNHWVKESDEDTPSSSFIPSSQTQEISSPDPPKSAFLPLPSASPSLVPRYDDFVPSSQSQYIHHMHCSPRHDVGTTSEIDFVPSSQSQYLVQHDDDGFVVPSSQSQWLLPVHLYTEAKDTVIDATDDEIPSSQTQFELELKPRELFSQRHTSGWEPSSLGVQYPKVSLPPDLDIDITDIFEDPAVSDAAPAIDDDSPTESDDDGPIVLPPIVTPVRPPSPQQDVFSLQSGYTGITPADGGSSGSSSGSLPAAVKDFYDMVGSGDGSYPDSFPESLKWTDQETQE
ncbi:hypothetical protein B0H11DRAFT_1967212 [Mycena galericulata]|nr:hypothetical protein B0H11DRAFT_1967212 [Mycena galericulata]